MGLACAIAGLAADPIHLSGPIPASTVYEGVEIYLDGDVSVPPGLALSLINCTVYYNKLDANGKPAFPENFAEVLVSGTLIAERTTFTSPSCDNQACGTVQIHLTGETHPDTRIVDCVFHNLGTQGTAAAKLKAGLLLEGVGQAFDIRRNAYYTLERPSLRIVASDARVGAGTFGTSALCQAPKTPAADVVIENSSVLMGNAVFHGPKAFELDQSSLKLRNCYFQHAPEDELITAKNGSALDLRFNYFDSIALSKLHKLIKRDSDSSLLLQPLYKQDYSGLPILLDGFYYSSDSVMAETDRLKISFDILKLYAGTYAPTWQVQGADPVRSFDAFAEHVFHVGDDPSLSVTVRGAKDAAGLDIPPVTFLLMIGAILPYDGQATPVEITDPPFGAAVVPDNLPRLLVNQDYSIRGTAPLGFTLDYHAGIVDPGTATPERDWIPIPPASLRIQDAVLGNVRFSLPGVYTIRLLDSSDPPRSAFTYVHVLETFTATAAEITQPMGTEPVLVSNTIGYSARYLYIYGTAQWDGEGVFSLKYGASDASGEEPSAWTPLTNMIPLGLPTTSNSLMGYIDKTALADETYFKILLEVSSGTSTLSDSVLIFNDDLLAQDVILECPPDPPQGMNCAINPNNGEVGNIHIQLPTPLNYGAAVLKPTLQRTYPYAGGDLTINGFDQDHDGISVSIDVGDDAPIEDVLVSVSASHPYAGELEMRLRSPDGTEVVLTSANGGEQADYASTLFDDQAALGIEQGSPPFTGRYRPEQSLRAFKGKSTSGRWKLIVVDILPNPWGGTLHGWTITFRAPTAASSIPLVNGVPGSGTVTAAWDGKESGVASPEGSYYPLVATCPIADCSQASEAMPAEDFAEQMPPGWQVESQRRPFDTWFIANADPETGCGNIDWDLWDGWAAVNSDCYGSGNMDESLISAALNLGEIKADDFHVILEFRQSYAYTYAIMDVDIRSSLTGYDWVTIQRWRDQTGSYIAQLEEAVALDITEWAAGATGVQIRWRYHAANYDYYWYLNDVRIVTVIPPSTIAHQILLAEGFNGTEFPTGWTVLNGEDTSILSWFVNDFSDPLGCDTMPDPDAGEPPLPDGFVDKFMAVYGDLGNTEMHEALISPVLDLRAAVSGDIITLAFDSYFIYHMACDGQLSLSSDGGQSWILLDQWPRNLPLPYMLEVEPEDVQIDLSPYFGQEIRLRWSFNSLLWMTNAWYLDAVLLTLDHEGTTSTVMNEDFSAGLSPGWIIEDAGDDWQSINDWHYYDGTRYCEQDLAELPPCPGGDNCVIVYGGCAAGTFDSAVVTPAVDLSGAETAWLVFHHDLDLPELATAEIQVRSSITAGRWTTIFSRSGSASEAGPIELDITPWTAGACDAQARWEYRLHSPFWGWWMLDAVSINATMGTTLNLFGSYAHQINVVTAPVLDQAALTHPEAGEIVTNLLDNSQYKPDDHIYTITGIYDGGASALYSLYWGYVDACGSPSWPITWTAIRESQSLSPSPTEQILGVMPLDASPRDYPYHVMVRWELASGEGQTRSLGCLTVDHFQATAEPHKVEIPFGGGAPSPTTITSHLPRLGSPYCYRYDLVRANLAFSPEGYTNEGESVIATVVETTMRAGGEYSDMWDGLDNSGEQYAPEGFYHLRIGTYAYDSLLGGCTGNLLHSYDDHSRLLAFGRRWTYPFSGEDTGASDSLQKTYRPFDGKYYRFDLPGGSVDPANDYLLGFYMLIGFDGCSRYVGSPLQFYKGEDAAGGYTFLWDGIVKEGSGFGGEYVDHGDNPFECVPEHFLSTTSTSTTAPCYTGPTMTTCIGDFYYGLAYPYVYGYTLDAESYFLKVNNPNRNRPEINTIRIIEPTKEKDFSAYYSPTSPQTKKLTDLWADVEVSQPSTLYLLVKVAGEPIAQVEQDCLGDTPLPGQYLTCRMEWGGIRDDLRIQYDLDRNVFELEFYAVNKDGESSLRHFRALKYHL